MRHVDDRLRVDTILSGKFRRYHKLPVWRQLLRFRTIVLPNIRDGFLIVVGTVQSFCKLLAWRPDVIFCKGGYVCIPVGVAGRLLGIPIVIHDSDASPGLTNRILSRWAVTIATGAPLEHYNYPKDRSHYVGVPVDSAFRVYAPRQQQRFKTQLGFAPDRPLMVVTGGGLGAMTINQAILDILDDLLKVTNVLLISGSSHFQAIKKQTAEYDGACFQLHAFISKDVAMVLAAADIVVARAGATTLLELAALGKPTIIVPNPYLTGGHQLKNAAVYEKDSASVVIDEQAMIRDTAGTLLRSTKRLLQDDKELARMGRAIHSFARPLAAREMAHLIYKAGRRKAR